MWSYPRSVQIDRDDVLRALEHVIDPELRRNIVELGMVRSVEVKPEGQVDVVVSLTTPTAGSDWYSVCIPSQGEYGTEAGVMCSFPIRTKADIKALKTPDPRESVKYTLDDILGESQQIISLKEKVKMVSNSDISILIRTNIQKKISVSAIYLFPKLYYTFSTL